MKLLGGTKNKRNQDENNHNVIEIPEVLVHCNIVSNNYHLGSRILHTFVPNNSLGQLLDISPENVMFLKTFDSEFPYTEVWFMDQNSTPLKVEDRINITIVIN